MPLRVQHKLLVQIGTDSTFTEKLFYPEDANAMVILDTMTNQHSGTINIAANTTGTLDFGAVAVVAGFKLKVYATCTVSINGGTAVTLKPGSVATGVPAEYAGDVLVTSLSVTNPGGTPLLGNYCVWGDYLSG